MNIIEKLEKYFNSGSTDKQNQRRLGGLLIAITVILLVVAIVATSIGGVVALVGGIIDAAQQPDEPVDDGTNSHLTEGYLADVPDSKFTNIVLDGTTIELTGSDYVVLSRPNRSYVTVGEDKVYLYGCQSADYFALQTEAHTAFNAMTADFYESKGKKLFVNNAYDTHDGAINEGYYTNALSVNLYASTDDLEKICPIDAYKDQEGGDDSYEWFFTNAYKYGFVRVSDAEGEESIFRYVGLAHAKYIYDKQKKVKDDEPFYGLDSYLAEIKATTPDTEMSTKNVKAIGQTTTASYYVYYMTVAEGVTCKLPKNSYDYNIQKLSDTEYIVTYWKATK